MPHTSTLLLYSQTKIKVAFIHAVESLHKGEPYPWSLPLSLLSRFLQDEIKLPFENYIINLCLSFPLSSSDQSGFPSLQEWISHRSVGVRHLCRFLINAQQGIVGKYRKLR